MSTRDEIKRQRHPELYSDRHRANRQDSGASVDVLPGLETTP